MGKTKIEWATDSWNPIRARNLTTGKVGWHCEHATTGCINCYAEGINKRLGTGLPFKPGHRKDVELFLDEKMLLAPLKWKKPRMIFPNSMTDLFADFVPDEWIDKIFAVMALCPQHTVQPLTKRAVRMRDWSTDALRSGRIIDIAWEMHARFSLNVACELWPLPNVWLGISAERQQEADERIPLLLQTPAAVRFLSAEPLLGSLRLDMIAAPKLAPDDESEGWKFNCLDTGDHYWLMGDDPLGPGERCIDSGDGPYRRELIAAGLFVAIWFAMDVIQFVDWVVGKFAGPILLSCKAVLP